ncbi:MAG: polysaccharide biosynthesis C-terminal domain-containing protein [Planctomycetota bacterium]
MTDRVDSPGQSDVAPALRRQVRGSSLLLAGRLVAIVLNLASHVALVRVLVPEDYGSLSFALALTGLVANVNLMGLARAMSRLVPLFDAPGTRARLGGALAVAVGTIALLGAVLLTLGVAFDGRWQPLFASNDTSARLLTLLLVLVPLTAVDAMLEVVAAATAGARAVFFRRHLMTPLLRLGLVLLAGFLGWSVETLALGYVAAGAVGVAAYALILRGALRERDVPRPGRADLPLRSVWGYAAPMLVVDLAGVSILHLPAIALERFHGSAAVAGLRAVLPLATLVMVVMHSFRLLYVPLATRTNEEQGLEELSAVHWAAVRWIGILSFPVFAVAAFLPEQVVPLLFGARYAEAAPLASIMALGYYLHAVLGVHALTLQALGRSRDLVWTAAAGIGASVAANLILVPRYSAVGAAVACVLTLVAHDAASLVLVWRSGLLVGPGRAAARPFLCVSRC